MLNSPGLKFEFQANREVLNRRPSAGRQELSLISTLGRQNDNRVYIGTRYPGMCS